ncbi:penicillin-binding protein 1C [Candidatus Palauibacter sp.]|uniref:penicillin-binding protein 1C n=1 Tax=Candidatus Palauibacter sp. TaxID=3101350 RepID=UPI003C6FA283
MRLLWARRPRRAAVWACAAAGFVVASGFATRLPDPLFDDPVSSVLEARDGSLLGARIASDGQWRFPGRDSVPGKFAAAVIAAEDQRFRWHPGVDPLALARAAWTNLRAGKVVGGGSTITMQVIRMSRGSRPRTYREKFVEAALALRLELGTDKDEVLALYAAHAPFGGNVVGLEAAAWRYFGRGPADLSWAEAAMLAVLPNNPGAVHPGRSRAELLEKRDRLLGRLQETGTIDAEELELALLEPLPDAPQPLPQVAPHLLQTLAAGDGGAGRRYASTLDAALQRLVGDVASRQSRSLASMGIRHLAALVVDNRTFEVVAYVGNSRWAVGEGTGHAIDLIRRPRSTGSILKPLLFARMLDAGEILPETLVPDIPSRFAGYRPENYDREFRGAVPARTALARSLNVPAVWMLRRHGVDRFYDFLRGMGMTTLHRPPGDYGLTLVLGGAEGTLWDITGMYANVARIGGGPGSPASGQAAGELARGRAAGGLAPGLYRPRILADAPPATAGRASLSVGAAWLTLEALVDVARPGAESQWRVFGDGRRVGWKTGTSYGHRDGWAVGVTARYTVGVWAGNASGEGRPELTGIGAAAPVLFDIVNRLEGEAWFPRPDAHLREVKVCRSDGYRAAGGCETTVAWAPRDSHFERPSPHHRTVHLDPSSGLRVHGRCESVHAMSHETWFALPPGQESFYRRWNAGYRPLPADRADCAETSAEASARSPVDFLYPDDGTRIYIPVELGGRKGRAVFAAAHRDPDATLHWHLDDRYVGSTSVFHEQALDVADGWHVMTIVDEMGNRARRGFEVLARAEGAGQPR